MHLGCAALLFVYLAGLNLGAGRSEVADAAMKGDKARDYRKKIATKRHKKRTNPLCLLCLFVAYFIYGWALPSLEAAPSFFPSASITLRAFPLGVPFFASVPFTVTVSPSFIVVRVQP